MYSYLISFSLVYRVSSNRVRICMSRPRRCRRWGCCFLGVRVAGILLRWHEQWVGARFCSLSWLIFLLEDRDDRVYCAKRCLIKRCMYPGTALDPSHIVVGIVNLTRAWSISLSRLFTCSVNVWLRVDTNDALVSQGWLYGSGTTFDPDII